MLRDRIQKQVYPQRRNTATILNYLEELVLINAKEIGLVPIDQDHKGYQDVTLPFQEIISLDIPEEAVSATMMVEKGIEIIVVDPDDPDDEDENRNSLQVSRKKEIELETSFNNTTLVNNGVVMRFKENGALPTVNSGFGLGNQDVFELVGAENLKQFKAMGVQRKGTPILRIQFYKTAQFK